MILYKLAHILRDKFFFVWNAVEWVNSFFFVALRKRKLLKISEILESFKDEYEYRETSVNDVHILAKFFAEQPVESFEFFSPHAFDETALCRVIKNRAFLTFVVLDGDKIVGYFFLRCFMNGKAFRGKFVDYRYRGKGIAKRQGYAMTKIAQALNVRVFETISPENYASLASSKAVNEVRILKTLDNGYYYIEDLPKEC
ncbi:MAG: transcriptional regulator [Salinivirgaceae bacterium]|nr:transcriptional regulator [Salinivirgaceae bacterium]